MLIILMHSHADRYNEKGALPVMAAPLFFVHEPTGKRLANFSA